MHRSTYGHRLHGWVQQVTYKAHYIDIPDSYRMTTYNAQSMKQRASHHKRMQGVQLTGQQDFCVSYNIKVMSTNVILYDVLAQDKHDLTPE